MFHAIFVVAGKLCQGTNTFSQQKNTSEFMQTSASQAGSHSYRWLLDGETK